MCPEALSKRTFYRRELDVAYFVASKWGTVCYATDLSVNWSMTDPETWRAYVRLQADLGVPSFYCTTHIDTTGEPLTEDDYRLIREMWAACRAKSHPGSVGIIQSGVNHSTP